jgi:hypothetical protein
MTPTEARALAEQLFNCGVPEPGIALYSLADQVEALQKDAERYRWLRTRMLVDEIIQCQREADDLGDGKLVDTAIDRARNEKSDAQ